MKKSVSAIFALAGFLLIAAFLGWSFSQHGTIGLYRVNGFFALIFNIFGILGAVLLGLTIILHVLTARGKTGYRWLAVIAIVLAVPAIVIPLFAFFLLGGVFSGTVTDLPPRLLMTDSTGKYGIPDMALVVSSAAESTRVLTWEEGELVPEPFGDPEPPEKYVFMLRDLEPAAAYTYQLDRGTTVSFTTPPLDGALHFAVGSDAHFGSPHSNNDLTAAMLSEIADAANGYDAFFYLGDLVEYGFLNEQWREALTSFAPVTSSVPTLFVAGNHDTLFSGAGNYLEYGAPEAVATQSGSRWWYRVDIGNVHFLVLDVEWSAETFTAEQAEWLEAELSSIPDDDWKIVLGHGFYYSSGVTTAGWNWYDNPETIEKLTPIFERYGVDLVFSGHNHRLELLEKTGITYVICGSFGGLPDPESTYTSPASLVDISGQYGFVDVNISGPTCELVFRDAGDGILYEHTLVKN